MRPSLTASLLSVLCTLGGAAADNTVPRLTWQGIGPRAVRLFWTASAPDATEYRLWRDDQFRAGALAGPGVFVDDHLAPQTLYHYVLEAVGVGKSVPVAFVTGPPNEAEALRGGHYDVVVYGATPCGLAAAVALGRRGRRVALVEPGDELGGMLAGGLGRTDFGDVHALGGLFRAFMADVDQYYTDHYPADSPIQHLKRGGLYFEPHVARLVLTRWLAALPSVTFFRQCNLAEGAGAVTLDGHRVTAAVFDDRPRHRRATLTADVFIDATYEADLAAAAGAKYRVGRESHDDYGEPHAGRLWWDVWQAKVVQIDGVGDKHVQAYNYRLCLTRDPAVRVDAPPPSLGSYHREDYTTLLPDIRNGRLKRLADIIDILELPCGKFDANNHPHGNPSSDLIGGADAWPEANWETRLTIVTAHRDHVLGLLYFLGHDAEVPDSLRQDTLSWGLAGDEFPEEGGFPSCLYVREGRRIVGDYTFTELDAEPANGEERPPCKPDSIAVGAYPIDSHATGGRNPQHPDWLEGFFYLARGETQPYSIPYRILLPQGVQGMLVCGGVSSTHVGYGSLRMEPVFMGLGLAAGLAADHALTEHVAPRQVDLPRLQTDLLRQFQVLCVFNDINRDTPGWAGFNYFGARGAFPSYEARPDEKITSEDWATWLQWADIEKPLPLNPETTRGQAMEALWTALQQKLKAGQTPPPPAPPPLAHAKGK
jgi:hypothetical protein